MCLVFSTYFFCNFVSFASGYRCKITKWDGCLWTNSQCPLIRRAHCNKNIALLQLGYSALGTTLKFKSEHKPICFCWRNKSKITFNSTAFYAEQLSFISIFIRMCLEINCIFALHLYAADFFLNYAKNSKTAILINIFRQQKLYR